MLCMLKCENQPLPNKVNGASQTEHSIVYSESELQTFHVFTNTEKKPLDSTNDNGLCSLFAQSAW